MTRYKLSIIAELVQFGKNITEKEMGHPLERRIIKRVMRFPSTEILFTSYISFKSVFYPIFTTG